MSPQDERFLLNHAKTLGFLASRGEEFDLGPEMRLDCSELLCNKVLLKYKGDREIFWHRHQKGAERVPHQDLFQWVGSSTQSINQVLELQLQLGEFHGWRHCFAYKGLCTQSYGFSSSHVWMWELDNKRGWTPKNWCFQIVVLEKTLESPLDCKEIKPVNLKEHQSWIFIYHLSHQGSPSATLYPNFLLWD